MACTSLYARLLWNATSRLYLKLKTNRWNAMRLLSEARQHMNKWIEFMQDRWWELLVADQFTDIFTMHVHIKVYKEISAFASSLIRAAHVRKSIKVDFSIFSAAATPDKIDVNEEKIWKKWKKLFFVFSFIFFDWKFENRKIASQLGKTVRDEFCFQLLPIYFS